MHDDENSLFAAKLGVERLNSRGPLVKKLLSLVCLLSLTTVLAAQTFRGGIQGTVTVASGTPVADVTVTIRNPETGFARTANTNASGAYFVSELAVGTYEVKTEKADFESQTLAGVRVEVSVNGRVDFHLKPVTPAPQDATTGAATAEVPKQSPMRNSTQDNLGGTLDSTQIADLAANGLDFIHLLGLVPGMSIDSTNEAESAGSLMFYSINGNRGRSIDYLLDGTDMNDAYHNLPVINEYGIFGLPLTILPLDSLQEVSVLSNTEAEYGRNSGATVGFVTKSGTNRLHGSAYEYFRNDGMDARNVFDSAEQPKNLFHNNQFGFSLGGPIRKDKTFFFASYEAQREGQGVPGLAHVPTSAEINHVIANNGGVINPVMANLLARHPWPVPNRAPDSQGNNLLVSTPGHASSDSIIVKVDHHFGDKDYVTGRFFHGSGEQSFPFALSGGGVLPGFNTATTGTVNVGSLSYVHILGMHLLTEVRAGYNSLDHAFFPQDSTFDPASIGLNMGTAQQDFGLPLINVSNFATLGAGLSAPKHLKPTSMQFFNNYTYFSGRHNWKFGYEYRRNIATEFLDAGYRGKLTFNTLDAFIAGTPSSGRQAQGNSSRQTFQSNHAFYLQDNYNLFSNFTLNYGVRWEYFGVLGEAKDNFSILDPSGNPRLVKQLYPQDWNNFAPRLSLAWNIRSKTVLRAGWGVYYDNFPQDVFVGQIPFNTFNSGPAFNGIGPDAITFSFAPATTIQPGVRVFAPSTFATTDVFTVDQKLCTPYVQNYNLNIEQALTRNMALQVGYVGSQGRKLFRYIDRNQVNAATGLHLFPAFGVVNEIQTSASSGYNAFQASLRIRDWHRITSTINYSLAHSIDNASDGLDYVPNASQPDNSFRPDLERANSNFDHRQRLTWIFSYPLPELKKWRTLTSGWVMDGALTESSGEPFNLNYLFEGDFNGSGEFFGRPDLVGDPLSGTHLPNQVLNLSAFQVPCTLNAGGNCIPGTQHFGNLGRNAFVGPGYRNFDFSLVKNTNLTERIKIQFRLDAFNLLNHPNFANPLWQSFSVDFLQNGMTASGRGIGFLPIKVTPDVGVGNPFLAGGGPRSLQLSLRFAF